MIRLKIKKQHDNREAANISTLSSGKTDNCEYLPDEEILPYKKNNSTSWVFLFLFGKIKAIEDQQIKQVDALMTLKLEELETIKDNKSDENEKL